MIMIKILKKDSYLLLKNHHVKYASTDSQNNNTEENSETVNPHHQGAENWEKIQSRTADYFAFLTLLGKMIQGTDIESLSTKSKELAEESENSKFYSDEETIINERNVINNQSELVSKAEDSLAKQTKNNLAKHVPHSYAHKQDYIHLQGSMINRKNKRDEALQERKKLEESWEKLLVNNTESEENLKTTTEQTENSEAKRKLDLSEQGESSKKQRTESEEKGPISLIDDFADLSQEPADYTGGDD